MRSHLELLLKAKAELRLVLAHFGQVFVHNMPLGSESAGSFIERCDGRCGEGELRVPFATPKETVEVLKRQVLQPPPPPPQPPPQQLPQPSPQPPFVRQQEPSSAHRRIVCGSGGANGMDTARLPSLYSTPPPSSFFPQQSPAPVFAVSCRHSNLASAVPSRALRFLLDATLDLCQAASAVVVAMGKSGDSDDAGADTLGVAAQTAAAAAIMLDELLTSAQLPT